MEEKILSGNKRGMAVLLLTILLYAVAIAALVFSVQEEMVALMVVCIVYLSLGWLVLLGLKVLGPQEALVLTLFGNYTGTLVNALTYHLKDLPLFQSGDMRAGLVHRIDKNTSGILVIAKNERAHARLAKQFFDHSIDRVYHALVWGNMESDEGTVTGNIGRSLRDRMKMAVFPDGESGKHAVTHYRVLERLGYVNLVECRLETGRTHQIRVHMEYIGHPLFNDERYGGDRILKGTTFSKYKQFVENCFQQLPRHALHARSLGFVHPSTGKYIYFESDLPEDMRTVIDRWRNYVANRPAENENE